MSTAALVALVSLFAFAVVPSVVVATPTATYVRSFGGEGSGAGKLSAPGAIATDSEGNIWVADTNHNRIQEFSSSGGFLREFGAAGSGSGRFYVPRGVATDPEGNIWVADSGNSRLQKFSPKGESLTQLGASGSGNGQFSWPAGVAIDSSGNLWVADTNNNRVQELNSKGEFIRKVGTSGTGNGQFSHPGGLATDSEGNLWVADTNNNRVQEFNSKGEFIRTFGSVGTKEGQLKSPQGITLDPQGDVWVTDSGNDRIQEFNAKGEYLAQFGTPGNNSGQFSGPQGVAADAKGNLWVADTANDRVQEFAASEFVRKFGGEGSEAGHLAGPIGVTTDSEGNVWVADTNHNRIQEFNPSGEFVRQFGDKGSGTGQFVLPRGIATDSEGNVWVSDYENNRLQEFNPKGEFIRKVGEKGSGNGQLTNPRGIAIDSAGNLWIADTGNTRIQEFNSKGEFIRKFGASGTGNGQFVLPSGIAAGAEGDVWVADSNNNRIQEFNSKGEFIRKFGTGGSGNGQLGFPVGLAVDATGNLWVADSENTRIQEFNSKGEYLSQLDIPGKANVYPIGPQGVAIDAKGNLWVADTANDRVQEFAAGEFIRKFGGEGSEGGHLAAPYDAATDPEGNVWVADTNHNRIQEFNPDGEFVGQLDGCSLSSPRGIATDSEGNVWVANSSTGHIQEFGADGSCLNGFGGFGTEDGEFGVLADLAIDPEGNIWALDSGIEGFSQTRIQEFDSEGEFIRAFGKEGKGEGQLKSPQGIATDPEGNVWVVDTGNDRIEEFSPKGEFIAAFGEKGTEDGQFSSPIDLAFVPDGSQLWVTDSSSDYVQEFTIKGEYLAKIGSPGNEDGQLSQPRGIAINSEGRIWIADTGNDRVQEWLIPGYSLSYLSAFGSSGAGDGQFKHPADVALDVEGNVWVVDQNNNRIEKFSEEGEYLGKFGSTGEGNGQFHTPEGIAIDTEGNTWVSDTRNGRLQEFDVEGKFVKVVSSSGSEEEQLGEPTGIDADASGNVWVADWQNNWISEFSEDGDFIRRFGSGGAGNGQFVSPDALAIDEEGNVWVGDEGNDRIQKFSDSGRYLTQFGTEGTGDGQFNLGWPMGVAANSKGDVWVTDSENNRVQRWQISTGPNTTISGGPRGIVVPNVTFSFTASETDSSFECSLDEAAFSACESPTTYEGLAEGPHVFQVRATNSFSTDETPAEREFEVFDAAKATVETSLWDNLERKEVPFETSNWSQTGWVEEIGGAWLEGYLGYGSSGGFAGAYWSPTSFSDGGATALVSATVGTEAPFEEEYLALWLDMPNPGRTRSGYEARIIGVDGTSSHYEVELSKWDAGIRTMLDSISSFSLSTGTVITLSETAGGSLALWTGTSTMSPVLVANDLTYTSGYAGLEVLGGEGTEYNFRAGQIDGQPPTAITAEATDGSASGASLHAEVNPNGSETTYQFEYTTAEEFEEHGYETATRAPVPPKGIGPGTEGIEVDETIVDLEPATIYHFRIAGTNEAGTSYGEDQTFRTGGAPTAVTQASSGVGAYEATFNAEVNPNGSETTYQFEYTTAEEFEEHGYETATLAPASPKGIGPGIEGIEVTETVEGLDPGTTYYVRVVTENIDGTTEGDDVSFDTSAVIESLPTCEELETSTSSGGSLPLSLKCKGFGKLTYEVNSEPEHGAISEFSTSAGTLKYTPEAEFSGTDSFTFLAANENGQSKIATATINVCGSPKIEAGGAVTEPETPGVSLQLDASLGCEEGGEERVVSAIRVYIDEELVHTENLQCEAAETFCRVGISRGIQLPYESVIGTHDYRVEAVDQGEAEVASTEWSETTPEEGTISVLSLEPTGGESEAEISKLPGNCDTPTNRYSDPKLHYVIRGDTIYGTRCADILDRYPGVKTYKAGARNDVIHAGGEIDSINGGAGNDRIYAGRGNDKIFGTAGNDQIFGGSGDDIIRGGGDEDFLAGEGGSDEIKGEADNDVVMGGGTADKLFGGPGTNTLSFADATTPGFEFGGSFLSGFPESSFGRGVYIDLGEKVTTDKSGEYVRAYNGFTARFGGGSDRVYIGSNDHFQNVIGSPFADLIVGSSENNLIDGSGGSDIIAGAGGDDQLYGGADSDFLDGGEAQSTSSLHGGDGDDICINGAETAPCERESTAKGLNPTSAGVIAIGRLNPDDPTNDTGIYLRGSGNNDNVTATWDGGHEKAVNNVVKFVAGGPEGTGRFDTAENGVSGCAVTETEAICPLNVLNTLLMDGGDGDDVLSAHSFPITVAVTVLGGSGKDVIRGGGTSEDTLVDGPGAGNDDLYGFGGDDTFFANEGRDRLYGADGSDLFVSSSPCEDRIVGGGGSKDIDNSSWAQMRGPEIGESGEFERPTNGVNVSLPQKSGQTGSVSRYGVGCGNEGKGTIKGIEFLEGSNGNDRLEADKEHNVVLGRAGKDRLFGLGGKDNLLANNRNPKGKTKEEQQDPDAALNCGADEDTLRYDQGFDDGNIVSGCENIIPSKPAQSSVVSDIGSEPTAEAMPSSLDEDAIGGANNPEANPPLAFFRLDETSGTAAENWMYEEGEAETGTYVGGVALGEPGAMEGSNAVSLDGKNDYINLTTFWEPYVVPGICAQHLYGYSMEMWVKFDSSPSGRETLFSRVKGKNGIDVYRSEDGRLNFTVYKPWGESPTASTDQPVGEGEWHHVVVTGQYDHYCEGDSGPLSPPQIRLYVDGFVYPLYLEKGYYPLTVNTLSEPNLVGARNSGSGLTDWLHATVDDVAIYRYPLSEGEVKFHMAIGDAPDPPVLLVPPVDPEDGDSDEDGVLDSVDNCPEASNPEQADADADGVGDACQQEPDADGDEISDEVDNCPEVANKGQTDSDSNGVGDACEPE
jgi:sugar lactone lactonase YvrE/Ca2+-binding RTX toxin-like protein